MVNSITLFYPWSAYLSAGATVLTFVTGILFFTIGKPFGKIIDISSVFQALLMIPLAVMFVGILSEDDPVLGLIAAIVGISGMLLSAYGQSLLVFGRIDFEGSKKYFPAGGAIGTWLITVCTLSAGNGQLPPLLAGIGILAGVSYLLTVIGFLFGGEQNVFFYMGAFTLGISYPIWALWLGRLLMSGILRIGAG